MRLDMDVSNNRLAVYVLLFCAFIGKIACPPPSFRDANAHNADQPTTTTHDPNLEEVDTGLEYDKYLKEVVSALEEDPTFKKHMENATADDWKSGKIANSLDMASHNIRTKLDEIKRKEVERLRQLLAQSNAVEMNQKAPGHLDAHNPHTFEIKDLHTLIQQTTHDLEEADRQRREEFKKYEMEKEHEKRAKLEQLSTDQAAQLKQQYEQMENKHKKHPQMHHPGTKAQLEEVWEKSDEMPKEDFNPKTFFMMHDTNSDGYLDPIELEALFQKELDKMYDSNSTEDDPVERQEESARMREHVMREIDTDRDGAVSLAEFLAETKKQEFNEDPGWKGLDEQELFSEDDMKKYEQQLEEMKKQGKHPQASMYGMPPPGPYYDPYQQQAMPPAHYGSPQYHPGAMQQDYGNMYPQGHPANFQHQQMMMQQQQQQAGYHPGMQQPGTYGGQQPGTYGGQQQPGTYGGQPHPAQQQQFNQQMPPHMAGNMPNMNHQVPPHIAAGLPADQHQQYMAQQQLHHQQMQANLAQAAGAAGGSGPLKSANLNQNTAPLAQQQQNQPLSGSAPLQQQQQPVVPNLGAPPASATANVPPVGAFQAHQQQQQQQQQRQQPVAGLSV